MKTLILCNGLPPSRELFEQNFRWSEHFIAADGGANIARDLGMLPDLVVGDLDSYKATGDEPFTVKHRPGQDTNDLEKALHAAGEHGCRHIRVLGATGMRLDHTLKNLSVMKQFNDRFETLLFKDDYGDTKLISQNFRETIEEGTQVSLFPLSGSVHGITTSGLKYPIEDGTLENGIRDGSSNEVVSNPVEITYREGDLLLFIAGNKH